MIASPATCGAVSALDPARWLRATAAHILPGAIRSVANGTAPAVAIRSPLPPTPNGMLDALGRELIDWGTQIGCARAVQHAERLVPGISIPYLAWQTFSSLSELCRGNIGRAMQTLPLTTLAPAALLEAVARRVAPFLPTIPVAVHQQVVIGLAICALLHQLAQQAPRSRHAPLRDSPQLKLLQALRTCVNALAGLQGIVDSLPARSPSPAVVAPVQRPLSAQANRTQELQQILARDFPRSSACLQRVDPAAATQADRHGLLPGADAAAKGRPAGAAAKPQSAPKLKPKSAASAVRRTSFQVRRLGTRRNAVDLGRPPGSASGFAGKKAIAGWAHGHTQNKDTVMSPTSHKAPAAKEKHRSLHRTTPPGGSATAASVDGAVPVRTQPTTVSAMNRTEERVTPPLASSTPPTSPTPTPAAEVLATCLRFQATGQAVKQVKHARFDRVAPRFCVDARAAPTFERTFTVGDVDTPLKGEWTVPHSIRESFPTALQQADIRKYNGLGQIHRSEPRTAVPLGSDVLYSVMSISALSQAQAARLTIPGTRVLARNSFKVVQHTQLDGTRRIFLAYFLNPLTNPATGVKIGYIEVAVAERSYSVVDRENGYVFSSDNLADFVAGIAKISGLRLRQDTTVPPRLGSEWYDRLPASDEPNLFVREEAAHATVAPFGTQRFNATLSFFSPTFYSYVNGLVSGVLYRKCFTQIASSLVFVDDAGRLGTLRLSTTNPEQGPFTVERHAGFEQTFVREHGLQEGETYAMEELVTILQNYGMDWLPRDEDPPNITDTGLDFFYVSSDTVTQRHQPSAAGSTLPANTAELPAVDLKEVAALLERHGISPPSFEEEDALASAPRPRATMVHPSTYRFEARTLFYIEHDGTHGYLQFDAAGRHGHILRLAEKNLPAAIRFAHTHGLQRGNNYARHDILLLLQGHGMTHIND